MSYIAGFLLVVGLILAAVVIFSVVPAYWGWRCRQIWRWTGVRRPPWIEKLTSAVRGFFGAMAEAERIQSEMDPYGLGILSSSFWSLRVSEEQKGISTEMTEAAPVSCGEDAVPKVAVSGTVEEDGQWDYEGDARQPSEFDRMIGMMIAVFAVANMATAVLQAVVCFLTCGGLKFWPVRTQEPVWELLALGMVAGAMAAGNWEVFGPSIPAVAVVITAGCWFLYSLGYLTREVLSTTITPADF